jgi:hypothetical protein
MKTLLSCDQVFETLTRGPFPTGGSDDEGVELHLAGCHECRCLAEALRPAATLFHESLSATEQERLPSYDGLLARIANEAIIDEATDPRFTPRGAMACGWSQAMQFGSAMLLGMSLCLALMMVSGRFATPGSSPRELAALPMVRAVYRPNAERLLQLASKNLPAVCFPTDLKDEMLVTARLDCCSQCHSPGAVARSNCSQTWSHSCTDCHRAPPKQDPAPRLFAVLQQSCAACHDS